MTICAISQDDGHSFDTTGKTPASGHLRAFQDACYFLEDDQAESYCYPSILETSDGFLVSYYHSNGTLICLNSSRITKEQVLTYLLTQLEPPSNAVMVGDTTYDVIGAAAHGIPTIGVAWGYGNATDLLDAGAVSVAKTPAELLDLLTTF